MEELLWRSYSCAGSEWETNPDLAGTWGLDADFKQEFDKGFRVSSRGAAVSAATVVRRGGFRQDRGVGLELEDRGWGKRTRDSGSSWRGETR